MNSMDCHDTLVNPYYGSGSMRLHPGQNIPDKISPDEISLYQNIPRQISPVTKYPYDKIAPRDKISYI